ncbi:glucosaminidase domain-containing protein [Clostridium sp. CM028]|uniref:Ig-like domain-containing protein n=1 Tax=unclassified Clostridium TaxID=2614128 RepID=UPI001C0D6110|nr:MULTISPECIES: Ig-like domain-containing protein [unclassified Clostridium]MBU3091668.1 glucosaminidase domain-containing protein [Clostridium sp. CF011]MBW9144831.1 glucosaminidase domain-containing protein [Clostridium sp. CM027]MBW9149299.1 glucosaminidase domain-containing protein [Clostridium sp. CM028]UVE40426.1 glucosaminidase domain-containing protein [Clostridium sp. CM027]WAG69380.1 Ig-like domain-containing protein [Clostridium sp. CF011]
MRKRNIQKTLLFMAMTLFVLYTNKSNTVMATTLLPSRVYVETPSEAQSISGESFNIKGWSLNATGIREIKIYIDNVYTANATYELDRSDVNAAFPGYPNGDKSGYSYNLDTKSISPGTHNLSVVSIGKDGSEDKIDRSIIINKKDPMMHVDTPIDNFSTTQKDIHIEGWALNDSGIKEIQYYLNDNLVGTSFEGVERSDVNAAYPGYLNGGNSGFSFSFNALKLLAIGTQNANLKIIAIGKDGTSLTINQNLILKKLPERLCVDTPSNNDIIKNNINIVGWALNASGVKAVNIYLDNIFKGKAAYGSSRGDVNAAFPGYTGGDKSGLNFNLDTSKTTPGNHTIRVEMVGDDGRIINQNIGINVYGMIEYHSYNTSLDKMVSIQLASGAVYNNTTTWTWDPANASMIKEYVDPSNIIDDGYRKYELLKLSYNDGASITDLNNVLKGKGVLSDKGQMFLNSAKTNNINPIYLISHAILETGNGTSALATGILVTSVDGKAVTPRVSYNLFGIGAYDSNANKYGSEYAYKQGWFTQEQAINGGAYFISEGYINNASTNQNTLYKMRWNPASPGTHQYATDVKWAYNQISNIKKLTELCPNSLIYFDIPVYK